MSSSHSLERAVTVFILSWMAVLAAALLPGCASSTRIEGAWVNPDIGQRPPLKSVLVIGINNDTTARRIFEDTIVAQLAARGIAARASYTLLPDVGPASPPEIERAVRSAGVDGVLVSRTVRVSTDIHVTPGHNYGPAGPLGFHGMWSGGYSTPPNIYTVQKVAVETRLFDVKDLVLLWSGSSTTEPTSSMEQTIRGFSTTLLKALTDSKVIAEASA